MEIEKVLRRDGIEIFTNTELTDARRDGQLKTILFQHHGQPVSVSAEEIFLAMGRLPNTASLDLDKAGVATERGRIVANEFMQPARRIFTPPAIAPGRTRSCISPCSRARLRRTTSRTRMRRGGWITGF